LLKESNRKIQRPKSDGSLSPCACPRQKRKQQTGKEVLQKALEVNQNFPEALEAKKLAEAWGND